MAKVLLGLLAALILMAGAARVLFYLSSGAQGDSPANEPWSYNKMEYVAWNEERWTAWIRDEAFVQLPQNTGVWSKHSSQSLAFVDWDGEPWQAKVDGDEFLLAHRGNWEGPTEHAAAIRYRDWTGKNQLRTVAQLRR